jgi:hypothetical protein
MSFEENYHLGKVAIPNLSRSLLMSENLQIYPFKWVNQFSLKTDVFLPWRKKAIRQRLEKIASQTEHNPQPIEIRFDRTSRSLQIDKPISRWWLYWKSKHTDFRKEPFPTRPQHAHSKLIQSYKPFSAKSMETNFKMVAMVAILKIETRWFSKGTFPYSPQHAH